MHSNGQPTRIDYMTIGMYAVGERQPEYPHNITKYKDSPRYCFINY